MAYSINASVAVGSDPPACDASCLVCHRRFGGEEKTFSMLRLTKLNKLEAQFKRLLELILLDQLVQLSPLKKIHQLDWIGL
jgi:hypothetical protein